MQAAVSIAEQSPMGLACASATIVESADIGRAGTPQQTGDEVVVPNGRGEKAEKAPMVPAGADRLFWDTSVGRFRFSMDQMPAQLRLTYVLLMVWPLPFCPSPHFSIRMWNASRIRMSSTSC